MRGSHGGGFIGHSGRFAVRAKLREDLRAGSPLEPFLLRAPPWPRCGGATPGRGGGEIDLIMRAPDGTLVFVEVRQRASASHGGAGASITGVKQRRIIFAARHYLQRLATLPPCRFDVVLVHGVSKADDSPTLEWLQSAFDAS